MENNLTTYEQFQLEKYGNILPTYDTSKGRIQKTNQSKSIIMKQLVIDGVKAKTFYKSANADFKKLLESEFGADFFNSDIRDTVKTFEDACKVLNLDFASVLPYPEANIEMTHINAYVKLTIIARALNEDWEPDSSNGDEYKWYPYFNLSGGSSVVRRAFSWFSYSHVGSRLCFKSSQLAEYAGKQFIDIYKHFLLIK